ncbi:MAG: HAD hydrolase-like protein [Candidatus Woesearchaeota archaeon]|nr:HAD hydrolase-like protein [Candidatus Woesearchaeota archaeon]
MKEQLRKSYTQAQARGIGPYKVEGEQEEVYLHLHPKLNKKIEKDLTRDAYLLLLHAYGLKNCKEFEELYLKNSTRKRELFPGVRETLENLEGKLDFVVVTDAVKPGIKLYESLPRMGIRKGVKSVVSSVDVGCAKPAPEFFDAVLQRCGYTKEEVAFVGHDYDEAVGAYRYGIPHIVLFNYDKKELERIREQIPPESLHVIPNTEKRDNFSEVSEIVRKINSKSQD